MDESGIVTRRRLLVAGGLSVFGITVGTVSVYDPTTLRYIGIDNRTEIQQTVEVRVTASGDRILEQEINVGAGEMTQVPCEWPIPARTYQVDARLKDETEWAKSPVRGSGDEYRMIRVVEDRVEVNTLLVGPESDFREREQLCEIPWWVDEVRGDNL